MVFLFNLSNLRLPKIKCITMYLTKIIFIFYFC